MLIKCASEIEPENASEEILAAQKKSLHEVVHELVRQITSPNTIVREQVGEMAEVITINSLRDDVLQCNDLSYWMTAEKNWKKKFKSLNY